jgi:hypothetical protein
MRLATGRRVGVKVRHLGEGRDASPVPGRFPFVVVHGRVDTDEALGLDKPEDFAPKKNGDAY